MWHSRVFPDDWKDQTVICIPKKGNQADCDNWPGVTLLSVHGKVCCQMVLNRATVPWSHCNDFNRFQQGIRQHSQTLCWESINLIRDPRYGSQSNRAPSIPAAAYTQRMASATGSKCLWRPSGSNLPPVLFAVVID